MTLRQLVIIVLACLLAYLISCALIGMAKLFMNWFRRVIVAFEWNRFIQRAWHVGRIVFAFELVLLDYCINPRWSILATALSVIASAYCLLIIYERRN